MKKVIKIICLVMVVVSLTGCLGKIEKVRKDYADKKVSFDTESVKSFVEQTPGYESHKCVVENKVIYITIMLENDSSIISAKSYINDYLLEELDGEVLNYYSISVGIVSGLESAMGMKQPDNNRFSWTKYEIE